MALHNHRAPASNLSLSNKIARRRVVLAIGGRRPSIRTQSVELLQHSESPMPFCFSAFPDRHGDEATPRKHSVGPRVNILLSNRGQPVP